MTNREVQEEAAGMGLCTEFFTANGIDPEAEYKDYSIEEAKGDKMYHSEDHLFFDRKENGDVQIIKKDGFDNVLFQQTLPNDIWCSIIASVSKLGEEQGRWYKATYFHNERPIESHV